MNFVNIMTLKDNMYTPGDFSFMEDQDNIKMLENMFEAITVTETWENLKGFIPGDGGFMFCKKPDWLLQIHKAIGDNDCHSGSSYGWTMRCMNYIAKHTWDNFVLKMSNPDEATKKMLHELELPYKIAEETSILEAWEKRLQAAYIKKDYESVLRLLNRVMGSRQKVYEMKKLGNAHLTYEEVVMKETALLMVIV